MRRVVFSILLLSAIGLVEQGNAQQAGGCSLPEPPLKIKRANIFSEQQAQWLGDALAQRVEGRLTMLPAAKSEYLQKLGDKLLAELPPAGLRYTFRIYESDEIRSFSLTGGEVYVSRKLILDAHSEDELAGVLAHEIGRVYTGHMATAFTLNLDKLMGVKSLGGEADVVDKYQRLLNIPKSALETKFNARISVDDEEKDQLLADKVGLYAFLKAGYAPDAYVSLVDRVTQNQGYWGNFLTDILELTPEISLRVRAAQKLADKLPDACQSVKPAEHLEFKDFQNWLTVKRVDPLVPATPGLKGMKLDPPMSPALVNVRLSPDGNYVLAQDEWRVHVLSRAPLKVLFSIDALGAQMAQFTPDSRQMVLYYSGLRFERWNVPSGRLAGILDFTDYAGCLQASLSPDGDTVACFSRNGGAGWLRVSNLRTGRLVYQDMNFYRANFQTQAPGVAMRAIDEPRQGAVAWSQDGHYFAAAAGTARVGLDLQEGKKLGLGNALSQLYESRMAFVDSDKLAFECDWGYKLGGPQDTFKMCYTGFPEGNPIGTFTLGRTWMERMTSGPHVLTGPMGEAAAALIDPATGKESATFKLETVDLVGDLVAEEAERGGISTGKLGGSMETAALPVTPLASLEAGYFSADGRFLAVSDRARGAVWDLSTGKQVSLGGPFRAAKFDAQDQLQARIVGHGLKPARNVALDRRTGKVAPTLNLAMEKIQYGSVVVAYKALEPDQQFLHNVEIDAFDAASGAPLWSRRFPHNAPRLYETDGDELLLVSERRSETGADAVDHNRKVVVRTADEIKEFNEHGLVVEVIAARTGVTERVVVAPEMGVWDQLGWSGQMGAWGRDDRTAALYGDLLAVHGNDDNTVVYRLGDGARLMAFFGRAIAGDAGLGLIAATNRPQEVTVYDVATGRELERVTLDHNVLAARLIPEKKQLLVLTATQHVYALDLPVALGVAK
jgi:hypothetical protein